MSALKQKNEHPHNQISFYELNDSSREKIIDFYTFSNFHYSVDEKRIHDHKVKKIFSLTEPQIFVFENFLSEKECDGILDLAANALEDSATVDYDSGDDVKSSVRTSQSAYFDIGTHQLVDTINQRISLLLDYPVERGESLHIARYGVSQEYKAHNDFFSPAHPGSARHIEGSGQRFATVLMYLNHVEKGGHTAFPELELDFAPIKGNAVLFFYADAFGNVDERCLHAGLPVSAGEKWIATKWLRLWNYY